jgi:sec-independent protein translocase protein TatA
MDKPQLRLVHFLLVFRALEGRNTMFGKLGMPELLIIFAVALLIFGPRKLGDLGKSLGDGIRSFKSAIKESDETIKT